MQRLAPMIAIVLLSANASAGDGQFNWPSQEQMNRIRNWNPHVGQIQTPGSIQAPGSIQTPGSIQAPGQIQSPKATEAVRTTTNACETHIGVLADALFDFDKANLRPDAEETLEAAIPEIKKATLGGKHPARVEGHTDGKGGDAYNMRLSEARARSVRDWLARREVLPISAEIIGYGKSRPVAPNKLEDGSDNPEGRQKNRRVEIAIETCKS